MIKAKRGRPVKPKEQKKRLQIGVRVDQAERDAIFAWANVVGMSVSDLVRRDCLSQFLLNINHSGKN